MKPAPAGLVAEIFDDKYEAIERYVDLLLSVGVVRGLIGPREVDRLWERHIFNSVALAGLVPHGSRMVDVGSGAGLPGIPLAVLRPDLHVTLLEPLLRRATFLEEAVDALGLAGQVTVHRGRAEDHRERYDVVVVRAVAPLPRLLGWTAPLLERRGVLLALKGEQAQTEVDAATADLRRAGLQAEVLTVRAHQDTDPATVVRVERLLAQ